MKIHKLIIGLPKHYILECVGQALIVDPGADGDRIIKKLTSLSVTFRASSATHGHFDHIEAIDQARDHLRCRLFIFMN